MEEIKTNITDKTHLMNHYNRCKALPNESRALVAAAARLTRAGTGGVPRYLDLCHRVTIQSLQFGRQYQ